jgi:signal transduction histidine kinase
MTRIDEAVAGRGPNMAMTGVGPAPDIAGDGAPADEYLRLDMALGSIKSHRILRTFVGGLAHTFNNLLTVIISNAAMVQEEVQPDSPARDKLHRVMAVAHQAAELTKQLLRYAQNSKLRMEWLDLSKLIVDLDGCFQAAAGSRIFVEYDLSPYLPEILGDREQLRLLVVNLFVNASEAIGDDVGVIHVRAVAVNGDRAMLASHGLDEPLSEGRYVWLQVSDTGCGMDEDTRQRLFEPFFTTKTVGRGLGLSEALGIVKKHHGAIWATSGPGQGSVFNVLLPCEVAKYSGAASTKLIVG